MKFLLADLENPQALDDQAIKAVQQADFLFNDGWHKDVESALYAKFLPIGAGILEHDYSYDHQRPQKDYFLETLGFEPTYEAIGIHLNSCARFWIRTSKFPDDDDYEMVSPSKNNKSFDIDFSNLNLNQWEIPEGIAEGLSKRVMP